MIAQTSIPHILGIIKPNYLQQCLQKAMSIQDLKYINYSFIILQVFFAYIEVFLIVVLIDFPLV